MAPLRETETDRFNRLLEQSKQARRPFDAEAWLNIAFFLGEQYSEWHDSSQSIRRIPRKTGEEDLPRPVINKIMHYIYQAHSTTLQDKPSADVLPATDDWQAEEFAEVGKAYINYTMEPTNTNWDAVLSDATLWALLTPAGWIKWVWNPVLKRADVFPVSYFDVYVDPYARRFQDARYVIHAQFMDPAQAAEQYGVSFKRGEIESADETRVELLRGMGSAPLARGVTVYELWHKPDRAHPNGLYAVWAGRKQLVAGRDLPYRHLREDGGRLPFTQLGALRRPDSVYFKSPVSYLRPAQMVLNKFFAQAILIQEAFAGPKWWIPKELDLDALPNSSPRQILRGNAGNTGLRPELLQPPAMANISGIIDLFEQQMMHIVGQHEVSQAQVPGRVEAAKAIELLKSSDEGRYKNLLDTIDQSMSDGFWQVLQLAKQFETENRQVMTYSREGLPQVRRFRKEAMTAGAQIRVVRMSGLGRTRAQRQESLLTLWREGIIKDPDLLAELMEVPIPSFTSARASDMRLARAENIEMAGDTPVDANSWDNHAIHIREHNEFRKTQEFRALSQDVKLKFEFHVTKHENLQIMGARKVAALMAAQDPRLAGAGAPTGATPGGAPGEAGPEPEGAPASNGAVPAGA